MCIFLSGVDPGCVSGGDIKFTELPSIDY